MDLFIFDFDDTLAITDSRVKIIMKTSGDEILMTSREFAHYPFNPSTMDVDFGDFMRAEGTLIRDTVEIMEQAILDGADVFIVTARAMGGPVTEFLEKELGNAPPVVATAGSAGKVPWLANQLQQNQYTRVVVFEDCEKNIRALKSTVEDHNQQSAEQVYYSAMCILPDQTMLQKESRWRREDLLTEWGFRETVKNFLRKQLLMKLLKKRY